MYIYIYVLIICTVTFYLLLKCHYSHVYIIEIYMNESILKLTYYCACVTLIVTALSDKNINIWRCVCVCVCVWHYKAIGIET